MSFWIPISINLDEKICFIWSIVGFSYLIAKEKVRIVEIAKDELSRYIELEEILGIETQFHNPLKDLPIQNQHPKETLIKELGRKRIKLSFHELSVMNEATIWYFHAGIGLQG
jgi:hypothetical protein